jgi:hypothetical protein
LPHHYFDYSVLSKSLLMLPQVSFNHGVSYILIKHVVQLLL